MNKATLRMFLLFIVFFLVSCGAAVENDDTGQFPNSPISSAPSAETSGDQYQTERDSANFQLGDTSQDSTNAGDCGDSVVCDRSINSVSGGNFEKELSVHVGDVTEGDVNNVYTFTYTSNEGIQYQGDVYTYTTNDVQNIVPIIAGSCTRQDIQPDFGGSLNSSIVLFGKEIYFGIDAGVQDAEEGMYDCGSEDVAAYVMRQLQPFIGNN